MSNTSILNELSAIIREGNKVVNTLENFKIPKIRVDEYFSQDNIDSKNNNLDNRFIYGDNLYIMKALLDEKDPCCMKGKVDLIYIDPPFHTQSNYKAKIKLPLENDTVTIEKFAYSDTWDEGMVSYLSMMYPRLLLMKELLSDVGSIYVHLDWHTVHYVKLLMDEVFGNDMFLNEIIWSYKSGGVSKKYFARKHDTILLYSKTNDYIFYPQKEKSYNRGLKPYRFKGVKEYEDDLGWHTFVNMKDVWNIDMVVRTSGERIGFDTQKPEELLERIILTSTNENSIVADFFAGSGTTAAVAEKYNRKWLLTDLGMASYVTTTKRLLEMGANSFVTERIVKTTSKKGKLILEHVDCNVKSNNTIIYIRFKGYDIDVDDIPLGEKDKAIVLKVLEKNSLALIDFISIDFDYNGENFISCWQDYRFQDKLSISEEVRFNLCTKDSRTICIRVVDVFGFESEYILDV